MEEKFTKKHKKFFAILFLILFILLSVAIFYFIGKPLMKFISDPPKFRDWIDDFGFFGRLIFILMVILQVIVAIIPGEPFEIAAGLAFGSIEGTILCIIGALLGSVIVFLLVKKFGVKFVEIFFSKEKIDSLKFIHNTRKVSSVFFILMLIPGTPKDLLSYVAGLTDLKLKDWIFISAFARIPSIISSSISGSMLGQQRYLFAVIAFIVTIAISIIGILIYRKIQDKNDKN